MPVSNAPQEERHDHISVCICTYRRPEMLRRALESTFRQDAEEMFSFEIVVVDNDTSRSAEGIVTGLRKTTGLRIIYDWEPVQNISLARNRAIRNASGSLIAFIDDDEHPDSKWLLNLYKEYRSTSVDGVLGPVIPHFEKTPPQWIIRSRVCERPRMATSTRIDNSKYTRTGNVLLSRRTFEGDREPFDPSFGLTGGGDADFFLRKMNAGFVFVWCDEAIVYETVGSERQKRSYYLKRAFTRGMTSARHEPLLGANTAKSVVAVVLYTVILPTFLIGRHDLFMKYLIKECDHLGKLLAHCKIFIVKQRPYSASG